MRRKREGTDCRVNSTEDYDSTHINLVAVTAQERQHFYAVEIALELQLSADRSNRQ